MLGCLLELTEQLSRVCSLLARWALSGWNSDHLVQQMPLPAEPFLRSLTQLPVFDFLNIKHLRIYVKNSAKTMWVIPRTTHKSKSSKYTLKSKYEFVRKEITSFWLLDFICKCALQTKGTELKEYILRYSRGSWSPHRTGKTAPPSFGGL